ncbi:MAG: molybdopterin synthase sulfur carrier subunit [Paraglaciecola sp.]|jgi:molybdopterin synthase sulfur carrier subunit
MLKILFFGQLRETLQTEKLDVDMLNLDVPLKNVADLRHYLRLKGGVWDEYLAASRSLVAVNQTMSLELTSIQDNDEVALFPPVTGG